MINYPALLRLLRPHQWVKNAFVFVGLIFGHAWSNGMLFYAVCLAALAFCLMSSAVYIYNDIIDHPQDRLHPIKKNRPLASGAVPLKQAKVVATLLFVFALGFGLISSDKVAIILLTYYLLNIAYTHILKHIVILDVFVIASGFMLRLLAGTYGVGIHPSQWLMFCGLMITLFLGFTKRRAETIELRKSKDKHRKVLKDYSNIFLDKMIGITAGCAIISYGLYTMSPDTVHTHGTSNLIYTTPFVIYGIFRYIYLLHDKAARSGHDTSRDLVQDKHLLIAVAGWLIVILILIA